MRFEAHAKPWWLGPEVEGALGDGRLTAIIREPPPRDALLAAGVEHVFLTEEFSAWSWLEEFATVFDGTMAVGVYATDTPRLATINTLACRSRLRVLLRFFLSDATALEQLHEHDEVSVGAPFDLLTFPATSGVRTVPSDYENDR